MVAIIVKPVCRQVVLSQALPLNTQEVKPIKNKNHKSPDRLMDSSSEVNCKGKHNIFKWMRQQQQAKNKKLELSSECSKKQQQKHTKTHFVLAQQLQMSHSEGKKNKNKERSRVDHSVVKLSKVTERLLTR